MANKSYIEIIQPLKVLFYQFMSFTKLPICIDWDSGYTYTDLSWIPNIIGVIYVTRTMGAVRIVRYIKENQMKNNKTRISNM